MENQNDDFERLIQLYRIYSDDLKKFDAISWQYPLALATANFLVIPKLSDNPIYLLSLAAVNFLWLYPLVKHIHQRSVVVAALQKMEDQFRGIVGREFVADFSSIDRFWWLRPKTLFILVYGLIVINSLFFFSSLVWVITSCLKIFP